MIAQILDQGLGQKNLSECVSKHKSKVNWSNLTEDFFLENTKDKTSVSKLSHEKEIQTTTRRHLIGDTNLDMGASSSFN